MQNYKMTISYDGTDFCGFQYQNGLRTVQGVLQENLFRVTNENTTIVGSGRTDAGVHAKAQVTSFFLEKFFEPDKIMRSLNSVLPKDLKVVSLETETEKFSARFSAKRKTYSYTIKNGGILSPFYARYASFIRYELDVEKMRKGAEKLIGEHNYKSFCKAKAVVKDYIKTVYEITITEEKAEEIFGGKIIKIYVTGKSFLHNMVRIMATALINCGSGKFVPQDLEDILKEEKRTEKIITADPEGLCLESVEY